MINSFLYMRRQMKAKLVIGYPLRNIPYKDWTDFRVNCTRAETTCRDQLIKMILEFNKGKNGKSRKQLR